MAISWAKDRLFIISSDNILNRNEKTKKFLNYLWDKSYNLDIKI